MKEIANYSDYTEQFQKIPTGAKVLQPETNNTCRNKSLFEGISIKINVDTTELDAALEKMRDLVELSTMIKGNALVKSEVKKNDTFYNFLCETYDITYDSKDRIKKTELEEKYLKWTKEKGYKPIHKKNVEKRARLNNILCGKYVGYWYYKGLKSKI